MQKGRNIFFSLSPLFFIYTSAVKCYLHNSRNNKIILKYVREPLSLYTSMVLPRTENTTGRKTETMKCLALLDPPPSELLEDVKSNLVFATGNQSGKSKEKNDI